MHLFGFIIRIYHDARSPERHIDSNFCAVNKNKRTTSDQLLSSDFIYYNSNPTMIKSNLEEILQVWKTYVRVVCHSTVRI